jgi:hypothetical protein
MPTPNPFDNPTPTNETSALFAANKNANARTMMPALGMPIVAGYRPSGRVGVLAFPLALLALVVVPTLSAWLYLSLWHFGHMLLLSQILLGVAAGVMLFPVVHVGKMRSPVMAGTLGVLIGLATFLGAMGWEAWQFRPQYIAGESTYLANKYHLSPQKARAATEKFYTPTNTIKFYWMDRASAGLTVTSSHGGGASHMGGALFWVVEGCELLLVTVVAALIAVQFSQRRFSEEFNRWFVTKNFGVVHPLHLEPLLDTLRVGNYAHASRFSYYHRKDYPHGPQVSASYLPQKAGAVLTVSAKTDTKKGLQTVFERELTNEEMKTFWPAFPVSTTSPASAFSS